MTIRVGDTVTTKQRGGYSRGVVEAVKSGGNVIVIRWSTGDGSHDAGSVLAHRVTDVIRLDEADPSSHRS